MPAVRRRRRGVVAAGLAAALALAACGGDDDESSDDTTEATAAAETTAAGAETTAAPETTAGAVETTAASETTEGAVETTAPPSSDASTGEASVGIGETELGSVLVDGAGMTLYLFTPDGQGPSTCVDDCLANWPALIGPATAGDGVDADLLDVAARPDGGGDQVTYNGWPLYYFASDLGPGDVSGQGLGDVWFVIDAAGEAVPAD